MPQTIKVSDFRTQIYLPQYLYRRVKQRAASRNISLAAVIREALEQKIAPIKNKKTPPNDLLKYAGIIKNEAPDVAENMDKYLKEMYQQKFP